MEDIGQSLDPTAEIGLEVVKQKAVKGVLALTGRTLVLNVLAFVAQGFLWAFLSPEEFGVFWIVSAIVNFLVYFSDIGLAAALIQKHEVPDEEDLRTTFTVQQILVVLLLVVLVFLTPVFVRTHALSFEGRMLLYALGLSFFLSSLKSIPSVLLERKLEFGKFIIPQVLENLVYNIIVVFLAWKGFGIMSFSYAVLVRGIIGLVAIYTLQPWVPRLALSRKSLKSLLRFGLPYQLNTLLAVIKDDGMTIVLGSLLGSAGIGILGTAQRLAQYPLRFFMDNVTKVTFPAFSRMQDKKAELANAVTRSIFFITFLVFPAIIGILILVPVLVQVIPRYGKWTPALIPLSFLAINTIFGSVTTQLTNTLNAIGKIKITFKLMIMWTVLTFLLVPVLGWKFGIRGAALGYAIVSLSSIIAIFLAKKLVNFSLMESTYKPALAAGVMGLILLVAKRFLPTDLISVGVLTVLGGLVYLGTSYLLIGNRLFKDVQKSLQAIFRK